MITAIKEKLPSTDDSVSPATNFDNYIERNSIEICAHPALTHYTGSETNDMSYVDAAQLNYCLTLENFKNDRIFAKMEEGPHGRDLNDYNYHKSLSDLISLFKNDAYSFTDDSIVYKGVTTSKSCYEILELEQKKSGDLITFHGFLSTTVSKNKAQAFGKSSGLLLIISGLDKASCIIPKNSTILNSPTPDIPEQEILLNKKTTLQVDHKKTIGGFLEITCSVIQQ